MTILARSLGATIIVAAALGATACSRAAHDGHRGTDAAAGGGDAAMMNGDAGSQGGEFRPETGDATGAAIDGADDAASDLPSLVTEVGDTGTDGSGDQADLACGPTERMFFVDPVDGGDDQQHTGARGCPFRTVSHALLVIAGQHVTLGASAPDVTIAIVNSTASSVALTTWTGEVFPLVVPAGVTITAANPDAEPPTFVLPLSINVPPPTVRGFIEFTGPRWHLSHVGIRCTADNGVGVMVNAGDGTIDHVSVSGCAFGVTQNAGPVTLGPGLVLQQNHRGASIFAGAATVVGGHGTEHTSISQNFDFGIFLQGTNSVPPTLQILAPAIAPGSPAGNDVAIDGNHHGLYIAQGPATVVLHGVHLVGNDVAIYINELSTTNTASLKLRASYLAGNKGSAIVAMGAFVDTIDLGGDTPADQGRNVFSTADQAADVNVGGAICASVSAGHTMHAAGNIFRDVDCATGGVLSHSPTCSQQADLGGYVAGSAIDLGLCTTH